MSSSVTIILNTHTEKIHLEGEVWLTHRNQSITAFEGELGDSTLHTSFFFQKKKNQPRPYRKLVYSVKLTFTTRFVIR